MILFPAIVLGLFAGVFRAKINRRRVQGFTLHLNWLVIAAVIPQILVFSPISAGVRIPREFVAGTLIYSKVMLLIFFWLNRKRPGFWLLGVGIGLNLLVILLNGGLMPVNPETLGRLFPDIPSETWQIGARVGTSKDIVLTIDKMKLWWFSDHFLTPDWFPYRAVFSVGDIFLAAGAVKLLWALGGAHNKTWFYPTSIR